MAFAVVNRMTLSRPIPADVIERMESELFPKARGVDGCLDAIIIGVGDEQLVWVIVCDTETAIAKLHGEVAGPWIGANIRPYVSATDRHVGTIRAWMRAIRS